MTISDTPPAPVKCKCENIIGEVITISGEMLFHVGGGVFRDVRGWCVQCGKPFYWSTTDKQLQVIIKSYRLPRAGQ